MSRIGRGWAAFLPMVTVLGASGMPLSSPRAELFTFAGRSVQLDMPRGWCRIDPKKSTDAPFYHSLEAMQQGRNQIVMVFADCQQLGAAHSGTLKGFMVNGAIMIPLQSGTIASVPSANRAQFAVEAAREFGTVDIDKMRGELRDAFSRAGAAGIDVNTIKSLGVLKQDELGIYPGFLMPVPPPSTIKTVMSINALTMINQLPVSVVITRPADRAGTADAMLAEEHEILRGLIAANAGIEAAAPKAAPRAPGIDWNEVLRKGLIGAIIGGAIGAAGYAAKRWRGQEADQS
jgi:hypothetical protein